MIGVGRAARMIGVGRAAHIIGHRRVSRPHERTMPAALRQSPPAAVARAGQARKLVSNDRNQGRNRMGRHITVSGVELEIEEQGQGRPLLFLHPGEGLQPNRPWLAQLARYHRVIAPHHPGFGGSALPDWFGTVDDLAYLYLDLAAALKLEGAVLVGVCFGGWVAAEIAVRNTNRFAGLLLSAPLGIKVGGVLDRDITDMHAVSRAEFMRLAWADPGKGEIDYTKLPDAELAGIARGRE